MGYELDGFGAGLDLLAAWRRELPGLRYAPLDARLGFVPGERIDGLGADARACGARLAEKGPVAFVSASGFGDASGGSAILWERVGAGEELGVNAALHRLGARGADPLEDLGLERNTSWWHGAAAVAHLPAHADAARAELVRLLAHDPATPVRGRAADELGRFGEAAIAPLVEAFGRDRDHGVRLGAAAALAALGPPGAAALVDLLRGAAPTPAGQLSFTGDRAVLLQALARAEVPPSAAAIVTPFLDDPTLRYDARRVLARLRGS